MNSDILASYADIFSHTVAYLEPCVTLEYSEYCHIQNPGIFSTQDIFRTLSKHILVLFRKQCNAFILRTLSYSELCHIQKIGILRLQAYSESCSFRHIQVYSGIFSNDSYNINFLFFNLILHTFQRNLKRHVFDYNDVNFNARLSLLK